MPAPYTIEQTASASGLSVKFIRRMKTALPELFEKHTERGQSNALLFDEEILEVLKQTKSLKNKGRTLQQIRDELAEVSAKHNVPTAPSPSDHASSQNEEGASKDLSAIKTESLERENAMLKSQNELLTHLLKKAEERFDRLLPEATQQKGDFKSQMFLWLTEAVVVTAFAAGFIFLIWVFAQKAFSL